MMIGLQTGATQLLDPGSGRCTPARERYPGIRDETTVRVMARDRSGDLWIGRHYVLEQVDGRTGEVTQHAFGDLGVHGVHTDIAGNVWAATLRGGLHVLPAGSERWRRYTTQHGLPSNDVATFLEDDAGHLWVGTLRGLVKIEHATRVPAAPRMRAFGMWDGLPGFEFRRGAAWRARNGTMLFGTFRGLVRFAPDEITFNTRPPAMAFTGLRVANREVRPGGADGLLPQAIGELGRLVLSPEHSVITLEFAALSFTAPAKNRYRYRLLGFDERWNDAGDRGSATYTSLPPGNYELHVQAANNDGVWNETGVRLAISQRGPFYRAASFLPALVVLLLGAALGLYHLRAGRHRRLAAELRRRIDAARADIITLRGLLPICVRCKSVRDDRGYWERIEAYVAEHTGASFSHGICPDCRRRLLKDASPLGSGRE
jgi:hypothetical protein